MSCNVFSKKNNNSYSIVFSPPNPPHYKIVKKKNNNINSNHFGSLINEVNFNHEIFNNINYPNINISCYSLKKINDSKNNLIIIHIKNTTPEKKTKNSKKIIINKSEEDLYSYDSNSSSFSDNKNKLTIIFSQSSKTDLGIIYPSLIDMSNILNCNIISYDYSGFGFSSGNSSIETINKDIEEVINFSLNNLEIKLEDIVLFGKKIGSIPSINSASKGNFCSIKGLILLSPIIFDDYNGKNKDKISIQNVIKNIKEIECPVLLIHGKLDDIISFEKIESLSKKFKECVKWFPEKGDHNNIISDYRSKYYKKLKMFLKKISESRLKIINKDIEFKGENVLNETFIQLSKENHDSLNNKDFSLNKEILNSFDNKKDLKLDNNNGNLMELQSLKENEKESNKLNIISVTFKE